MNPYSIISYVVFAIHAIFWAFMIAGAIKQASQLTTLANVHPILIPAIIIVSSIVILGLFGLGVFLVLKSREE